MAPSKPRSTRRRAATASNVRAVPNAIAVRYCVGHEKDVRDSLGAFGRVDMYPSKRMAVLQKPAATGRARLEDTLDRLRAQKAIDFVTPVLLDTKSQTRQVLTDEIILRLKPGRTRRTLQTLGAAHGVKISHRNEFDPAQYVLKVSKPSGTETLDIARSLDASDDVEFACPNYLTEVKS